MSKFSPIAIKFPIHQSQLPQKGQRTKDHYARCPYSAQLHYLAFTRYCHTNIAWCLP